MEKLAYLVKRRFPAIFHIMERLAVYVTVIRFGARAKHAFDQAIIAGIIRGKAAVMRGLDISDADKLHSFLQSIPGPHMQYFKPHDFELPVLQQVMASKAILNYGLFVENEMVGYGLLKLSPTGSAFMGLVLHPDFTGCGLGSFISRFLYWQASLAGLRPRATISLRNIASMRAHQAVADYKVVSELPNDYLLIEFPSGDPKKPVLSSQ
jgi:hypothetical protein